MRITARVLEVILVVFVIFDLLPTPSHALHMDTGFIFRHPAHNHRANVRHSQRLLCNLGFMFIENVFAHNFIFECYSFIFECYSFIGIWNFLRLPIQTSTIPLKESRASFSVVTL